MSDLSRFAEHCRRMATSTPATRITRYVGPTRRRVDEPIGPIPDRERALWQQLAHEIDTYLHPHHDDDPATVPLDLTPEDSP